MDVNEIFKLPSLPKSALGSNKRKAAPAAPAFEAEQPVAKVARLSENGKGKQRATVEDVADGDEEEDVPDQLAGLEADYFAEEDAEGRFYGGGLSREQKEILKIMDTEQPGDEGAAMTVQECRKLLLALERAVNKNRELRTKFGNDPQKFIDSEMALDEALNSLLLLTENAALFYPEMVRLNTVTSLIDLLSHENPDISITVIKVLEELTDEDIGERVEDEDAFLQAFDSLLASCLENALPELLASNISRFSPTEPAEQQGLYHSLGLIENLLSSSKAQEAGKAFLDKSNLLTFLLQAIQPPGSEQDAAVAVGENSNRFYAAEMLAILLSLPNVAADAHARFLKEQGIDAVLKCLSGYRKRDPKDAEVEYMENLFDCICTILSGSEAGKKAFREAEGPELMVLLMKEKRLAKTRSIKVLDFAMSAQGEGAETCLQFVESLGLKTLFPVFMGKAANKKDLLTAEDTEHILGILASLLTALESDSPPRVRVLAKFVEQSYEKVDRLLELRELSEARIARWEANAKARAEVEELDEDERLLGKLENGLATLQLCDYILAWVVMEDDGVRDHAAMLLKRQGRSWQEIAEVLREYASTIGGEDGTEGADKREVIGHLMAYIQGL